MPTLDKKDKVVVCYLVTTKCVTCKTIVEKEAIDSYSIEYHLPCCAPMMITKVQEVQLLSTKDVHKETILEVTIE